MLVPNLFKQRFIICVGYDNMEGVPWIVLVSSSIRLEGQMKTRTSHSE